jgi:hypothetical protein
VIETDRRLCLLPHHYSRHWEVHLVVHPFLAVCLWLADKLDQAAEELDSTIAEQQE